MSDRHIGVIAWFDAVQGVGEIRRAEGPAVVLPARALGDPAWGPVAGQSVSFKLACGASGLEADDVILQS